MQLAYIDQLMYDIDQVSQIGHAKRAGIAEGKEEGVKIGKVEEKREIAKSLLGMGLSLEQVMEGTGLSLDAIQSLQGQ